ncbi:MAG: class I SAM-dependent methyltransferase [Candidatus Glassbacteria bacterium]
MMKKVLRALLIEPLALVLRLLPHRVRVNLITEITTRTARFCNPVERLRLLFELDNRLYKLQGQASVEYGGGIHSKHRHLKYHDFFIRHTQPGERLLDIGCGNGAMDYDLVTRVDNLKVVGIEIDPANIEYARRHYIHPNLTFIHGDVLDGFPDGRFDVVTLSNVLEHIEDRVGLLRKVCAQLGPKRIIIRVPSFERDWRVPLKEEVGVDYRLDPTHCIEYTEDVFLEEMRQAGLEKIHLETRWGEIWAVLERKAG